MDTATDGDGIVVVGEGLLEVGVHRKDAVVVPELDLALEDLRQDAAGQVEAGGSVGDAGDVGEDGDGAEDDESELRNKWKRRCVSKLLKTLEKASQDLGGPRELLENRLVEYEKKKAAQEAAEVESESNTGSGEGDAVVVE